ncbi:MAG: GNAT family N-acetyltransferase [Maribacter sp.]
MLQLKDSPYNSSIYSRLWEKHYGEKVSTTIFKSIVGPQFVKSGVLNAYKNRTSNLTLQHYYEYNSINEDELFNKLITIYDVPSYLKTTGKNDFSPRIKQKVVTEYNGFLIDMSLAASLEVYLKTQFNSKSRSKFRSYFRKLESSVDVAYKMFHGEISKENYEYLITHFYELSIKSFESRRINNKKLHDRNFEFIKEVFYELLLDKKACLFVMYDKDKPIGICLNYTSKDILFGDSTVYDLNYSNYNIGIIMIIKQLEWCFEKNIKRYDFSKGYFLYKEKWCNNVYKFEHHIIYDSKNIVVSIKAYFLYFFLSFKQYLREHKLRAYLKRF